MGLGTVNDSIIRQPDFQMSLFGKGGERGNQPIMRVAMNRRLSLRQELDLREVLDTFLTKEGLA